VRGGDARGGEGSGGGLVGSLWGLGSRAAHKVPVYQIIHVLAGISSNKVVLRGQGIGACL
jgi:hypothetical protein